MKTSVSNEIVVKCVQADIKFENALVLSLLVKESSGKDIVCASLWLSQLISYANIKLATLPILQCQHTAQQWPHIFLCQSEEKTQPRMHRHTHIHA